MTMLGTVWGELWRIAAVGVLIAVIVLAVMGMLFLNGVAVSEWLPR